MRRELPLLNSSASGVAKNERNDLDVFFDRAKYPVRVSNRELLDGSSKDSTPALLIAHVQLHHQLSLLLCYLCFS